MAEKKDKLPVKIIADSLSTFQYLEGIIGKLNSEFVEQFETLESGFSVKFTMQTYKSPDEFKTIGRINYIGQEEDAEIYGSKYNKFVISMVVVIDDKEETITGVFFKRQDSLLKITSLRKSLAV